MKKNMGNTDRAIRILAAVVLGTLALTGQIEGTLGIILGVIAAVFLITALLAFCPLYVPLKLSTLKKKDA
ncbi:MAG TPA: DUF2892 domain-containing protein [Bacteroidota bacterium]|nr:DUF2892 domain-containing protein [Bacteroidota bacterium]